MLKRLSSERPAPYSIAPLEIMRPIDLAGLARGMWRNKRLIAFIAFLFTALALLYCLTATRLYTSSASILIEPRQPLVLAAQPSPESDQIEAAYVDSQVEVIKSGKVLARAVTALQLADDPEFAGETTALGRFIANFMPASDAPPDSGMRAARAADGLKTALQVKRAGLTYVLTIAVTTRSPEKSARIANGIGAAFLEEDMEAKADAARSAAGWLQRRVDELRELVVAADGRVQEFKIKNNIVAVGKGLMTDQQVSEITTQLVLARTQLSEAQAKFDKLGAAIDGGFPVLSDAPPDSIAKKLQEQMIANDVKISQLAKANGERHSSVQKLRAENSSLNAGIQAELKRTAEAYANDLSVAKERVASLEGNLTGAVGTSNAAGSAQVALNDLEREAESYRAIYQQSLGQLQEATQRQSFPVSEYRIITAAMPVLQKSWPKTTITLALAAMAGLAAGGLGALYRASRDGALRSLQDVNEALGTKNAVAVPRLAKALDGAAALSPPRELAAAARKLKLLLRGATASEPCAVIAITSTERGEGRSTLAAALAQTYAASAFRTLLIDADLKLPRLSAALAASGSRGLASVLTDGSEVELSLLADDRSGVHFLAAGSGAGEHDLLGSPALAGLIGRLRERYDAVVIDVAPLSAGADALAIAPYADAFVYVVASGTTQASAVLAQWEEAEDVKSRIMAVALNFVPQARPA
jgi:polysaccharide biosynthesis transport protein